MALGRLSTAMSGKPMDCVTIFSEQMTWPRLEIQRNLT